MASRVFMLYKVDARGASPNVLGFSMGGRLPLRATNTGDLHSYVGCAHALFCANMYSTLLE